MAISRRLRGVMSLRHAVPLLALLLEVLWAHAWFYWIGTLGSISWASAPINLLEAIALAMMAESVTRYVLSRDIPIAWARLIVLSVMGIALAALIRLAMGGGYALWDWKWSGYVSDNVSPIVGGLVFGVYLIWRGMSLGRETLSFSALYPKFLMGMVALVVLLAVWNASPGVTRSAAGMGSTELYVIAYFFAGLVGLAVLTLVNIRQKTLLQEDASAPPSRLWLSLTLVVIFGMFAVAIGIISIFSLDLLALLLHPLGVITQWTIMAVFLAAVYLIGFPAAALVYILRFLVSIFGKGIPPQPPEQPNPTELRERLEKEGAGIIPPELIHALEILVVVLIVALVVYLMARTLSRYRRGRGDEEVEQISESLWSWKGLAQDILAILNGFLNWLLHLWGEREEAIKPPPAALVEDEDDGRVFSVRELYQGLLWEGKQSGFPRGPSATPFEYQSTLERRLPAPATELQVITQAYVAERYGPTQMEAEVVGTLNLMWRRLRTLLRREQ